MPTVASLVFEMSANVARLQTDMSRARSTVETAMDGIKSAAVMAQRALGALGVAASVTGLVEMIHGAIESENALHELGLRTGQTVETLSALRGVAKQSGTDMDAVATGVQKLSKNMLEAQAGTGKSGAAFQALGIRLVDANGKLRDGGQVMQEVGQKLTHMENQTQAVAIAQQLMGKSGANLLPFLTQLAESGTLVAKVTTDQAEAAHQFEVNLAKLESASTAAKVALANDLLPALNKIGDAMVRAREAGEGWLGALRAGIRTALTGDDRYKNDKDLVELTEQKLGLEKQIAAVQDPNQAYRGVSATRLQQELAGVEAKIKTTLTYRKVLEDQEEADRKAAEARKARTGSADLPEKQAKERVAKDTTAADYARSLTEQEQILDEARKLGNKSILEADAAAAKMNATLEAQAERWREVADPSLKYFAQLKQIEDLEEKGKLTAEEADKARQVTMENISKALGGVAAETEKTDSFAKQMGLTFSSAFEAAMIKGKNVRDVLKGIESDIAAIIIRQSITNPAGAAISSAVGSINWGGIFGASGAGGTGGGGQGLVLPQARAGGGDYSSGPLLVGEQGPELLWPGRSGTVTPNGAMGGNTFVFNVQATDVNSFAAQLGRVRGLLASLVGGEFAKRR